MCWSLATCARLLPSARPESVCASCGEAGAGVAANSGLNDVFDVQVVPLTSVEPGALVRNGAAGVVLAGETCSSCSRGECSGSSPTAAAVAGDTPGGAAGGLP